MKISDPILYTPPEKQGSVTYWDYISLDSLLKLHEPRTEYPDEKVFIIYHQITELYFRLILLEMEQICCHKNISPQFFADRLRRINNYFTQLIGSFGLMTQGIDKDQFLKFRTALFPASGFQSFQFRLMQLYATDAVNLTDAAYQERSAAETTTNDIELLIGRLYWRASAATEKNKENITLHLFDKKYLTQLVSAATQYQEKNIRKIYHTYFSDTSDQEIITAMKTLDTLANVSWPLAHLKLVNYYLNTGMPSTGGTHWQKYLHPKFQRVFFFPELWTEDEKERWGLETDLLQEQPSVCS